MLAEELFRATGLIGHWTGLGGYLIVVVSAACCIMIIHAHDGRGSTVFTSAVLVFAFAGLVSTFTFSVIATGAVILAASAYWAGKGALSKASIVVLAAAIFSLFWQSVSTRLDQQFGGGTRIVDGIPAWLPSTVHYRVHIWTSETFPAIAQRPLTGWGSGVYESSDPGRAYPAPLTWPSAESQWLSILIHHGSIAFVAFVFLIGSTCKQIWRCVRVATWVRPFGLLMALSILASFTVPMFTNRGFPALFWPVIGAAVSAAKAVERKPSQAGV